MKKVKVSDVTKKGGKKVEGFFKEFKEFAMKGNVLDLAVGMMIGSAFGKIVSSLVNDIFMPVISSLFNIGDFTSLKICLRADATDEALNVYLNQKLKLFFNQI